MTMGDSSSFGENLKSISPNLKTLGNISGIGIHNECIESSNDICMRRGGVE